MAAEVDDLVVAVTVAEEFVIEELDRMVQVWVVCRGRVYNIDFADGNAVLQEQIKREGDNLRLSTRGC